ncbi:MAG: hypothetical protein JWP94_1821 [Mucilaginibacter sp.]|nr:hypothetical protein [Mucilaginibacter sp.]
MDAQQLKADLINHVVKSTVNVIMENKDTGSPVSVGSGTLIVYRSRLFFISVQHVTDKLNLRAVIDTGSSTEGKRSVYVVPQLNYIDQYKIEGLDRDDPVFKQLKTLDITYAEIREMNFSIEQPEKTFEDVLVTADKKRMVHTDLDTIPDKAQGYSFYGRIRGSFKNNQLIQTDKFVLGMAYDARIGDFERFELGEVVKDEKDFQGTSGAPICGETGDPVAFVAHGFVGQKYIYGFSARELKKYLNIHIDTQETGQ